MIGPIAQHFGEVVILSTAVSAAVSYGMNHWTRKPRNAKGQYAPRKRKAEPVVEALPEPQEVAVEVAGEAYSVSGGPHVIPWRLRKREREAATRTKRAARDSFREEA